MPERCDDKPQNYDEIQSTINVYEECGRNKAETARKMGIRRGTVITRIQQAEALGLIQDYKTKVQETVAEGMEVFGVAEVEKRNAEQAQNPNRVNATCRYQPEESEQESIADQWRDAEEKSIKRIRRSLERHYFDVEFPDDGGPIAIAAISDQHIAPGTPVDFRQMRIDAELVRDTPGVYAMLGGDGVDNHIKHHSAVLAARSTPDEQWKLFEHYLDTFAEKVVSVVSGNHCVDEKTEILTRRGWLSVDELSVMDEALGMNLETSQSEWQEINTIIVKPAPDELVSVNVQRANLVCDPEHRVLGRDYKKGGAWKFRKAKDNNKGCWEVPCAAPAGNPECDFVTDDEIRFAAWLLTDGHIGGNGNSRSYNFSQRESNAHHIDEMLEGLEYDYSRRVRKRNITEICGKKIKSCEPSVEYRVNAESTAVASRYITQKTVLPEWVDQLSARQFRILLETVVNADGSPTKKSKTASAVIYGPLEFLNNMQAACVRHGYRTKLSKGRPGDWRLYVCDKQTIQFQPKGCVRRIPATTKNVWCVNVKHGNFMVRRNGSCHFTGNCDWSSMQAGINMLERIARDHQVCYAPDFARITAHVGKQKYELAIRHKYRYGSTLNQVHTVKRWFDMGEEPFDCGVICHHHEAAMEAFQKHGRMRWGARPGSYQISSSYSRANGFNPSIPTCPTFVLFPDEHRIIGFSRLQDAVWAMQKG